MNDRQQAGAPKPPRSQDAPDKTNKLNYVQIVQAVEAGKSAAQNKGSAAVDARIAVQNVPAVGPGQNPTGNLNPATQKGAVQAAPLSASQTAKQAAASTTSQTAKQATTQSVASRQSAQPNATSSNKKSHRSNVRSGDRLREPSTSEKKSKFSKGRIAAIVALVLAVILVLGLLAFSWNQWLRGNDETDVQGVWQIAGSESTITITKDYLQLTPDVKYTYTIDPVSKIITFSFEDLTGQAHYRFSLDRNQLAIIEGTDTSFIATFFDDFGWSVKALFGLLVFQDTVDPGVVVANQSVQTANTQSQPSEQQATDTQEGEIKQVDSSQYVLSTLLSQKANAIKGIKSTTETTTTAEEVEVSVECIVLIRTDQALPAEKEKSEMIVDLRSTSTQQSGEDVQAQEQTQDSAQTTEKTQTQAQEQTQSATSEQNGES